MNLLTRNFLSFGKKGGNLSYRETSFLKKLSCFIVALSLTSAMYGQIAPWGNTCPIPAASAFTEHNCAPPNCPPLDDNEASEYRGIKASAPGCSVIETPAAPLTPPTLTCPVQSIRYSLVEDPPNEVYLQYCTFAAPNSPAYDAKSQGWINQLFCGVDGSGLPAAPTGITFSAKSAGLETNFIGEEVAPLDEEDDAQLLQLDFWMVLPPTLSSVGIQIGDTKADATALWLGPNLGAMCPVAEFIEVANERMGGVDNWVGYGNRTGYYPIPATVSQDCNLNILRARMYISDIEAFWKSDPLIDIGSGFVNITTLPLIAATGPSDNAPPTLTLMDGADGFVDANGNVFDVNGNWIPVACQTPGTDATDIVTVSATNICLGDPAPNYTITGEPGATLTYNIDGGTAITITLDATTGIATIPASATATSTLNLVSVNFLTMGSCALSGTASVTVLQPATPIVTGGTFCAGTAATNFSISGTPSTIVSYNIDGGTTVSITLDAAGNATIPVTTSSTLNLVSVGFSGTLDCTETLSGSVEIVVLDAIPAPSVTGGTFCEGTTANFTLSGTPNTIVSYNIDGGTTTSITIGATGIATVPATVSSTLNLISVNYSGPTDCSPMSIGGSTTITIETCVTPTYTWTFLDPCNCDNPNNITLADGTFLIADFIEVDASEYISPVVTLAFADTNFLDSSGNPIAAATASFTSLGGGIYRLPYYVRVSAPATFTIDVDGDQQTGTSSVNCACDTSIPTMSQWGLIIFGLLILNVGIFFLYRKEGVLSA